MSDEERYFVKARGLPWSATSAEVLQFFSDCSIVGGEDGVKFGLNREGRPSGEAFVEVESLEDVNKALVKDREKMGKRYIEVFECKEEDMERACQSRDGGPGADGFSAEDPYGEDAVVRLRGLPFDAGKMQIADFFKGLEIESNGILLVSDQSGRSSGEAFVQFTNVGDGKKALLKNKEHMGRRYIEVFSSSMDEANRAEQQMSMSGMRGGGPGPMRGGMMMRPGPYDRHRGYGGGMGGRGGGRNFGGHEFGFGGFNGGGPGGMRGYGGGMGGFGGGGMRGGRGGMVTTVRMRGLPFRVSEQEIAEWFSSVADPVDVCIHYNAQGRPSGDAEVCFASEAEARRAMQKNRQNMQHRYIELFLENN